MLTKLEVLKYDSSIPKQISALCDYNESYHSKIIFEEIEMLKKGLAGENEVLYQLEKSNLKGYLLHDVRFDEKNYKAQIDFILITEKNCYFIECKNYQNNINIDEMGTFYTYVRRGKYDKKVGMESPLNQVELQLSKFKNIIYSESKSLISKRDFENYFKTIVAFTNSKSVINAKHAPEEVKNKVIRADNLVRKIEEIEKSTENTWLNDDRSKRLADYFLELNNKVEEDNYLDYYKKKFNLSGQKAIKTYKKNKVNYNYNVEDFKQLLNPLLIAAAIVYIFLYYSAFKMPVIPGINNKIKDKDNIKNVIRTAEEAKEYGFSILDQEDCKKLGEQIGKNISCSNIYNAINYEDNEITLLNNFVCYKIKTDEEKTKFVSVSSKYVGYDKTNCSGYDYGVAELDSDNEYLIKAGPKHFYQFVKYYKDNCSRVGFINDITTTNYIASRGGDINYNYYNDLYAGMYLLTKSGPVGNFQDGLTKDNMNRVYKAYYYLMK